MSTQCGLDVRAVDGAGNRGKVERASFSVDATGPATKIDSAPDATTRDSTPVLRFSSPDADAVAFQCSVDGGEFTGCGSPHTVAELGDGPHTVDVRARDDLGNVGAAQQVSFTVDTTVPDTKVRGPHVSLARRITVKGKRFKGKIRARARENVEAMADGTLVFRPKRSRSATAKTRRIKLKSVSRGVERGERKILRLRFKGGKRERKRLTRKLKRTLRKGNKTVRLRAQVTLTDEAGNSVTKNRSARLRLRRR